MSDENLHNENPLDTNVRSTDVQKRISSHYLTRIENQMDTQLIPAISVENNWTLTDQSLFRLF